MVLTAGNWNTRDDEYSEMFLLQNLNQYWMPEEVSLTNDINTWKTLSQEEKDTYSKVLAGLTLLDTLQGDTGMPDIAQHVKSHQKKAVFTFMAGMETAIHARSYSNIFQTLESSKRINELFEWVKENHYIQQKGNIIKKYYEDITDDFTLAKAMCASVALETFLFYSGFYYPLYLAGQGKLVGSGEIISLIIRDESIHGTYTGLNYQELCKDFTEDEVKQLEEFTFSLFDELLENEIGYTRYLYDPIDLSIDVIDFIKYNANKALNNLGYDNRYEHDDPNPIVLNGLNTGKQTHDFFSVKGDSYKKAKVVAVNDDDFYFN